MHTYLVFTYIQKMANEENFNSKKSETAGQSLYLLGRCTDLPLLVFNGNFTKLQSPFAFDLHSLGDWFLCVLACNDLFWPAEVVSREHRRLGGER